MNTTSTAYFRKSDKLFTSTASVYIPKTESQEAVLNGLMTVS